jgi:transposase InsO family protein
MWEQFHVEGDLVLAGTRLLVQRAARKTILDQLHLSHSGMSKTNELARQLYYWPGMVNDVNTRVSGCMACVARLPSLPFEPVLPESALYPMEKVATDLFDLDAGSYLVMVDRFSGYPWVSHMRATTTEAVCRVLLGWFWEFGFPRRLKSDNGPQFRGQFVEFCGRSHILPETSAPYNPRSNGLAEAAVKSVKFLLGKVAGGGVGEAFRAALLAWRTDTRLRSGSLGAICGRLFPTRATPGRLWCLGPLRLPGGLPRRLRRRRLVVEVLRPCGSATASTSRTPTTGSGTRAGLSPLSARAAARTRWR